MSEIFDKLQKCTVCGKALPCFNIEWSNLPDDQKCKCAKARAVKFPAGRTGRERHPAARKLHRPFGVGTNPADPQGSP